ncbi:transcriptional regulator [Listeria fleischmannii subsp. coloradonensis]|uniref:MerR family DNA-binding transcriptional regulator n=1 Tax=Listeria fleischmannii TaxID=1069827 RepID=UPI000254F222|nr:MerR family DNA-binding transcriptional regulator [Listeria fleischmannii]EIA19096.1 transcriptional regulator [Listeria fleischmannii subsp. coloradonensis]
MSLSIKEASEQVGMSAYTIRYYESVGLIPFLLRDENNNRVFDDCHLLSKNKLSNSPKKATTPYKTELIVELTKKGNYTVQDRIEVLKEHRKELEKKQQELDLAFQKIEAKLACYEDMTQ